MNSIDKARIDYRGRLIQELAHLLRESAGEPALVIGTDDGHTDRLIDEAWREIKAHPPSESQADQSQIVHQAIEEVRSEVARAVSLHPRFHSIHEGYAVILEASLMSFGLRSRPGKSTQENYGTGSTACRRDGHPFPRRTDLEEAIQMTEEEEQKVEQRVFWDNEFDEEGDP